MSAPAGEEAGLIWCPFADTKSAREAIAALLNERLIACANILPGLHSLYIWQGARTEESECGALLKTAPPRLAQAMERLEQLHPYDQPAITGWVARASVGTARWLEQETGEGRNA